MATLNKTFRDIDLSFKPHPITGDLMAKYDEAAIKTSVKNLILTRHYERPFHSEVGSSVGNLLFELPNPSLVAIIKQEIIDVIQNFEPRVIVQSIEVNFSPDTQYVDITIQFVIVNTTTPIVLDFTLKRTR
jgi:phage baseplate assembly protein W